MKTLLLTLLLSLSLPVLAKGESPIGLFQVDSSRSQVTLSHEHQELSGFIDVKENFPDSSFRLETGDGLFESTRITGDWKDFEVLGTVTTKDETKEVTLRGTIFGVIEQEEGHERMVLKLTGSDCVGSIFALKPKESTAELHATVREIFR